jgi:hypothetical protein
MEFFIPLKTGALISFKKQKRRSFLFLKLNIFCSLTKIIEQRKNLLTTISPVTDELASLTEP